MPPIPFHHATVRQCVGAVIVFLLLLHNLSFDSDLFISIIPTEEERSSIAAPRSKGTVLRKHNATKVAFVVTITGCDNPFGRETFHVVDGAAVLAYSIHQNSVHGRGRYEYDLYAFHHPNAAQCTVPLERLGYMVQERDTPVALADIRNEAFRHQLPTSGCCGERELIKFEAFTLTQYPVVVLLDVDTLVLQPLDRLLDFVLNASHTPDPDDLLHRGMAIPDRIDILYTNDNPKEYTDRIVKPTQGGFVVLRPNKTVYRDILDIVKQGDFRSDGTGWGGRTGIFWGSTTFQGLLPYYFQILYPERAMELNHCKWNNNNFSPREGNCDSYQEHCEDCRLRPIETIALVHYTTRLEMERSWGRSGHGKRRFHREMFLGFCSRFGPKGYQPME